MTNTKAGMNYILNPLQNPEFEFKRLLKERAEQATSIIRSETMNPDQRVHDFRTNLKMMRAVLRLMRFNLGEEVYAAENAFYRNIQQELAPLRDSNVRMSTLESLLSLAKNSVDIRLFDKYYADLNSSYSKIRDTFESGEADELAMMKVLERSKKIATIAFSDKSTVAVVAGLKKIYRQGRNLMATAREDPTPENMHEWRKKVKYLWYHVELLKNLWKPVMKGFGKSIHQLSDFLGDEHDLSVLIDDLEEGRYKDEKDLQSVLYFAESRKKSLHEEAFMLGKKVFHESPKKFAGRIGAYWQACILR